MLCQNKYMSKIKKEGRIDFCPLKECKLFIISLKEF
jgi:hypothetical protein